LSRSSKRAVLFVAWGDAFVREVLDCIAASSLPECPVYLLTDEHTRVPDEAPLTVLRTRFALEGKLRKAELLTHLPSEVETWLFLDSDTCVLADLELGFEKAEQHGLALALAPHGTLEAFRGFGDVMDVEGVPRAGQAQLNTGVLFFRRSVEVDEVFETWHRLCLAHADRPHSDQPYFTLALEKLGLVPYVLSPAFNYRGVGEWVSGSIRVWHSRDEMPSGVNDTQELRRVREGEVLRSDGPLTPIAILRGAAAGVLATVAVLLTALATRPEALWAWLNVPVLLALAFVLAAPGPIRRSRTLRRAILVATVLTALLGLPELGLRAAGFQHVSGARIGPPRAVRFASFVAHDELLWTRHPADSDVNELGFPGPEMPDSKPPGTERLLFLGDSCTAQGYPRRVEQAVPGVEAVTLACQGYSSWQGRRMAELYGAGLEPDAVFVYFGWNDHWLARSAPDAEREAPGVLTRWRERSRLLQLLASLAAPVRSSSSARPRVTREEYRANLNAIIETFAGVPTILVTAPSAHAKLDVPDYLVAEGFALDHDSVLAEHTAYNEIVREVAAEKTDAHVLDLERTFDQLASAELEILFRKDGIHFTAEGLDRVADEVAAFVTRKGLAAQ